MRLTALGIERYGNLDRVRLELDPAPGRLNLVVAPNGAGKSVLRQAFSDLLFGIPGQTPMGFRFHYKDMRLRAEAVAPDGSTMRFGRRKGHGNTLIDEIDGPLAPAVLDRLLGRTDRAQLERLLALDTERLRTGGRALLAAGGDFADALLSAAGGRHRAGEIRADLVQARDEAAPERRNEKRPFYRALDAWVDARKALREGVLRPDEHRRREAAWREAKEEQDRANQEAAEAAAALRRLERARRIAPMLAKFDAAQAWLDAHPDAPALPHGLRARLAEAQELLHRAEAALRSAEARRGEAVRRLGDVAPDDTLLAQAERVQAVVEALGAAQDAARDLPGAEAETEASGRQVAAALRALGSEVPPERATDAVPPLLARRAARGLVEQYREVTAKLADLPQRLAAAERDRDAAQSQLAALPAAAPDRRGLAALVREVQGRGDPGLQATAAELTRSRTRHEADFTLCQVPGWTAGIDALVALSPSPHAVYEGLYETLLAAERTLAECTRRVEQARDALAGTEQAIREAEAEGAVPDEAAVAGARQHRDRGWQLVFRQAFTDVPPRPAEIEAWTGGVPLPLAYERATAAADTAADRRLADAERVQRAADRARTREQQAVEFAKACAGVREAEDLVSLARADWAAAVAPLDLGDTAPVTAIREVLARRAAALEAERRAREAEDAAMTLAVQHRSWAAQLAASLGSVDETASLPDLLRRAVLAEEVRTERAVTEERLRAAQGQLAELRGATAVLTAELEAWRAEWTKALVVLGQAADLRPEAAGHVLDLLDQLEGALGQADRAAERTRALQARLAAFGEEVAGTARAVAPDLAGAKPFEAARALGTRLDLARSAASQRAERRKLLETAEREATEAAATASAAATELRAVLAVAGAEDDTQAVQRIELAEARALHELAQAQAMEELREAGDGQMLPALREEVASASPEERATLAEQARERQEQAGALAQEAAARATTLAMQLTQDAGADAATRAVHDEAAATASLARVLEEVVLMQLAVSLLDHGLQAVERRGDGPVVARIGTALRTLTLGAYEGVVLQSDEKGKPRLMAIERAHPGEPRAVDELSEGTRDQLFLALRLVAIEDHLDASPPLPFVADDILQTFDDARATATLQALLELSMRTQVLVLTHHEHVLDLAGALPPGTVHVQRFGGTTAA